MYNPFVDQLENRPKNFGPMRDATTHARIKGPCGDTVEMWLRIDVGRIRRITFLTDGCESSIRCCAATAALADGRTPEQAYALQPDQVLAALGDIPADHAHCATLAVATLHKALATPDAPRRFRLRWRKTA